MVEPPNAPNSNARGIMFCHGAAGSEASWFTFAGELMDMASNGWVVYSPLLSGASPWGNDTSTTKLDAQWTAMQAAYPVKTDKLCIWCSSMGASTAINFARRNPTKVAAIGGTIPVLDQDDIHDNNRGSFAAAIETAYTNLAGWNAAEPTNNPINNAASLSAIPMKFWTSSDDPVCLPAKATAWASAHGNTTLVDLGAIGHTVPTAPIRAMSEFFQPYIS